MKQRVITSTLELLETSVRQRYLALSERQEFDCLFGDQGNLRAGDIWLDPAGPGLMLDSGELFRPTLMPLRQRLMKQRQSPHTSNLARAVGLHKKRDLALWDISAGLGQDLYLLHHFGARDALAFERHPTVFALLFLDSIFHTTGFDLRLGDFSSCTEAAPDTIYFDPMYPEKRKKSALSKKGMEVFKELVGDDSDAATVLEVALKLARERVVVKRPPHAKALKEGPSFSYESKTVRFDIYLCGHHRGGR
jgi:16S rRNA (guanine1516-N2)-methyltransferase